MGEFLHCYFLFACKINPWKVEVSGVAHSDPILLCSVSFFFFKASISVLKSLKIGSYLSVSFSVFNPGLASRRQSGAPRKT